MARAGIQPATFRFSGDAARSGRSRNRGLTRHFACRVFASARAHEDLLLSRLLSPHLARSPRSCRRQGNGLRVKGAFASLTRSPFPGQSMAAGTGRSPIPRVASVRPSSRCGEDGAKRRPQPCPRRRSRRFNEVKGKFSPNSSALSPYVPRYAANSGLRLALLTLRDRCKTRGAACVGAHRLWWRGPACSGRLCDSDRGGDCRRLVSRRWCCCCPRWRLLWCRCRR